MSTNLSGTTVTTVIFEGNKLICLNAGDSRAIKVRIPDPKNLSVYEATQLTYDHKPESHTEKVRIKKAGGRIQAFKD